MARVLIVDDDQADRIILGRILEGAGHDVYLTSDDEQALKILLKRSIDVVVTDLQMPKVHGLELIMKLRTLYPEVGIIIAVSATGPAQLAMAEAVGANVVLSKPVDPNELVEAIAKAVPGADDSPVRGQGSS